MVGTFAPSNTPLFGFASDPGGGGRGSGGGAPPATGGGGIATPPGGGGIATPPGGGGIATPPGGGGMGPIGEAPLPFFFFRPILNHPPGEARTIGMCFNVDRE